MMNRRKKEKKNIGVKEIHYTYEHVLTYLYYHISMLNYNKSYDTSVYSEVWFFFLYLYNYMATATNK